MASLIKLVFVFIFTAATFAVEVKRPRGVSLTNRQFYDDSKPFICLDGSMTISFERVNDDYCDCNDGSDEPGTSACQNGQFHCTNAGYRPLNVPSSRVNDGICDCCDATDEYNSGAVCENTCKELGVKERESLKMLAEVAKEGFQVKQQLIEEARKNKEEKKKILEEKQEYKKLLQVEVEKLKAAKEAAEAPEKEALEKHRKMWEELKEAKRQEQEKKRTVDIFKELDKDEDSFVSLSEVQAHTELDEDGDGTLSESEAQIVLGGATQIDLKTFQETVWSNIKNKYKSQIPELKPPEETETGELADTELHPKVEENYNPDDDDDDNEDDEEGGGNGEEKKHAHEPRSEEDHDDDPDNDDQEEDYDAHIAHDKDEQYEGNGKHSKIPVGKPGTKKNETVEKMPDYNEETRALIDAAKEARDNFKVAEKNLYEVEEAIGNLEKEFSMDFGKNNEFAYMYGKCYEITNEYAYKLCPFDKVTQTPKHGGLETSLGTWTSWADPEDNNYSMMKYEDGTSCWQGPNRSTKVKLTCGKETAVISCTEPSRCEYLMELQTPAICEEPQPLPMDHDEL
ncbi:glucosidase 2 subunit beta [Latimeria chalumnae]|uniref:Glucosidase 2 subunit beta n=1 Tax=Latimeria chalumnae TaxID=7897 RepID=H3AMD1_LATCH|nr:PREDICTED: glucosidase 2 subunit beta-like [Latimeria chalumnae]|eukprot:XP_006004085.1 PREDICTED: glucosidase 2 subunit beta-like [Latimeria chalumnae]